MAEKGAFVLASSCHDQLVDELTPDESRLWRAWKTATESVRVGIAEDVRASTGLSDADYSILSWVIEVGGGEMVNHALEKALGFTRSQLLHRVGLMARRGWVIVAGDTGGRVWVRATESGRAVLDRARPAYAAAVRQRLLERFADSSSQAALLGVLTQIGAED